MPAIPPSPKFNTGDSYAIHKVIKVIDGPGQGKGDLIVGNPPGSTNLSGTSWPHYPNSVSEPSYSWNNTLNGVDAGFKNNDSSNNDMLRINVNYFNLGGGFGGTPSQVSTKYVAALNGVNYTGPYVYPHPLVSGPRAPENLRVARQ
jgi:hypothetical protein